MTEDSTSQTHAPAGFSALSAELMPVMEFARRWWMLAVVMVLLSTLTTFAVVVVRGVEYQVSAALFYKLGPELGPPPTMGKDPLVITRRAEDVNDEIEILTSPDLFHQVVVDLGEEFFREKPPTTNWGRFKRRVKDSIKVVTNGMEESLIQLGLRRRLTFLEKVELGVASKMKVDLVRESDVISVTFDTPAPEAGVVVLDRLLAAYQARHLTVHQEVDVKEFLTEQTDKLRKDLAESTEILLTFQKASDLWSADDQQKLLLDNRKVLQLQVSNTRSQAAHLGSLVASLSESISQQPETVELSKSEQLNPAVVDMEDRVASLNMNLAVVETSYRTGSREIEDRRSQIEGLRKRIDDQPDMVLHSKTTGTNVMRQDLSKELALRSAELKGMRDRLAVEEQQLAAVNRGLQELGAAIARFQHLEREHGLLEQKYALYSENFEKADIASVMNLEQISNMKLISPPVASKQPVRPRLSIMAAAGIVSGLALAFAIAVAFDLRVASRKLSRQT